MIIQADKPKSILVWAKSPRGATGTIQFTNKSGETSAVGYSRVTSTFAEFTIPADVLTSANLPATAELRVNGETLRTIELELPAAAGGNGGGSVDFIDKNHFFNATSPLDTTSYSITYQTDPAMFEQLSPDLEFKWLGESGLYRISSVVSVADWTSPQDDYKVEIDFPNSEDYYDSDYFNIPFPFGTQSGQTSNQIMPLQTGQKILIYAAGVPLTNQMYEVSVHFGVRRLVFGS